MIKPSTNPKKCTSCANYLSRLGRCKFCSYEEDKSKDHQLDALRCWFEGVAHQKLFGQGFKPNVYVAGIPIGYGYVEKIDVKSDNMIEDIKINYDNVTVNGVKAKSFSLNTKNNEVIVEWEEDDFNLLELIKDKGIDNGVNKRLNRFDIDYDDCFYDIDVSVLYVRTDDISNANKSKIRECFDLDYDRITTLSDNRHELCSEWGGGGWFAIRVE